MNFNHFIQERGKLIEKAQKGQAPGKLLEDPLTLAYLGDAWFSLYIRSYLCYQGWQNVRLLQSVEGKIASATYQAIAWRALEEEWTEEEKEKALLLQTLEKTGDNRSKAARLLNVSRTTLYEKLRKYHIID